MYAEGGGILLFSEVSTLNKYYGTLLIKKLNINSEILSFYELVWYGNKNRYFIKIFTSIRVMHYQLYTHLQILKLNWKYLSNFILSLKFSFPKMVKLLSTKKFWSGARGTKFSNLFPKNGLEILKSMCCEHQILYGITNKYLINKFIKMNMW